MNKKTKWGIIILIGAGIIGGGIYSQLPKTNDELAAADKVKNTQKNGKKILNVNAKVIKPQLLTDEYSTTGVLLPDEEVDLSFEKLRGFFILLSQNLKKFPNWFVGVALKIFF